MPTSEPIEALIFSSEVDLNFESLGIIEQFGEKFCWNVCRLWCCPFSYQL